MKAREVRRFEDGRLGAAYADASGEGLGWRLEDGTEVLLIGWRLQVAEPGGRLLEQDPTPNDVPVSRLVEELRAREAHGTAAVGGEESR